MALQRKRALILVTESRQIVEVWFSVFPNFHLNSNE